MKLKFYTLSLLSVWLFAGAVYSADVERCFPPKPPDEQIRSNSNDRNIFSITKLTSVLTTGFAFTSIDHTTAEPSSNCNLQSYKADNGADEIHFLAYNVSQIGAEAAKRQGEFISAAAGIFGCGKDREAFFQSAAGHFSDVFREGEYGLSYAVRLNRLLDKEGICSETPVRNFLREADRELSLENPAFPASLSG